MLDKLQLNGTLKGSYDDENFKAEFKDGSTKLYFDSLGPLKALKDLLFDKLKAMKDDPQLKKAMESVDMEIYLEEELIARIGKNAKSNFVSSMLGVSHFEVVTNSRMSELMELM
jgi:hypothetical protein